MLSFYDYPAEHWGHIRSTNPIESLFCHSASPAAQNQGGGETVSRLATLTMVFKLSIEAEKRWRRLNGYQQLAKVIDGVKFTDGIEEGTPNPLAA